ncbi:MAG: hypothetical protein LC789_15125 [Actinobacteria bacterium]|nr:hypothetical protein [Actinomycetota bacterium]MCA1721379.1 hypothetical protein [Actinomycetota bacterium]
MTDSANGYVGAVTASGKDAAHERRRRRQELLDSLREAAELRARLTPRASALARSRALLHSRTTRG